MLQRWIKHRDLSKHAECKICAAARGFTMQDKKKVWKRSNYICSICKISSPPSNYDYKNLARLEEEEQVYLAVCLTCESKGNEDSPVKCVGCKVTKNRNEFSFARQRCKNYLTWRCLLCDFPPCARCGVKPGIPKRAPYTCEACLFPPCKCGAQRPRSSKYKTTNEGMETWTCSKCRNV